MTNYEMGRRRGGGDDETKVTLLLFIQNWTEKKGKKVLFEPNKWMVIFNIQITNPNISLARLYIISLSFSYFPLLCSQPHIRQTRAHISLR